MRVVGAPFGDVIGPLGSQPILQYCGDGREPTCQQIDANPNPETAEMLRATVDPSH